METLNRPRLLQIEILFHLVFWLVYFFYPVIKFGDQYDFGFELYESLLNLGLIATSVYLTYFSFKFLTQHPGFIPILLALIGALIYLNCSLKVSDCNCSFRLCLINKSVEYAFVNTFFLAIVGFKKYILSQQALQKSEEERVRAELKGLKAQINPHFLFNTLNMLYANATEIDKSLAEKILKLSDNLHYLLHEGGKQEVPLIQEVNFIEDYISLQKARLGEKIAVDFQVQTDKPHTLIPPLLLIPFVENAFKYTSMMKGENLLLNIFLRIEKKQLEFIVQNQFRPELASSQSENLKRSGIGIKTTLRRLHLLYPDRFSLHTAQEEELYKVIMKVDLA
ncbi:MAG: histidine kinase [Bacteroidia bacterium]|nr:histidine kinase [Bacteroidia bacterium]